jgi:catechol 2,3-dioxygenase-like lactoylglutathione lyase family enzyme
VADRQHAVRRVELDHTILPVNDRDASLAFCTDVLGLHLVEIRCYG